MNHRIRFVCIAVSSNTDTFGNQGAVLVAPSHRIGLEVAQPKYGTDPLLLVGQVLTLDVKLHDPATSFSWEEHNVCYARNLRQVPLEVCREVDRSYPENPPAA